MTSEEKKHVIQSYITAYNNFDIDGMLFHIHPEIIFKNVIAGEVNAEAVGAEQFRDLAVQAKALFSSRHQKAVNFIFSRDVATVDIEYEAVLASDLPNSLKGGSICLNGRSEFEFRDGKIYRITDQS